MSIFDYVFVDIFRQSDRRDKSRPEMISARQSGSLKVPADILDLKLDIDFFSFF